ncbi:MAG: DUF4372 domain-containing protein, partial [bacterium]
SQLNTVLNELLQIVPRYKFDSLVSEYKNDRYVKYYTTYQQRGQPLMLFQHHVCVICF